MNRIIKITAWLLAGVPLACLTGLAAIFLWCSPLRLAWLRVGMSVAFVAGVVALFVFLRPRWKAMLGLCGLLVAVGMWFALIRPSNDRAWQPGVARLATAEIDGDHVTIHNVRDFRYRSDDEFDERWETRSYDLRELERADVCFCQWRPGAIAHTMLTFGFEDGSFVCLSVGPRPEIDEGYEPVRSFFKAFELVYTLGDERDLIAVRTNVRHQDVYLFPVHLSREEIRELFLDVLHRANSLARAPEFYRTISDNCTTALIRHFDEASGRPTRWSVDLILNGYLPRLAYERGDIPTDAPLEVVMKRFAITDRATAAGVGPDFSLRIREGLGRAAGESGK